LIPAGSVFAFLAEHRGELFPAAMFVDMYPSANGRPSMPPQILAAAITLQALHGLSDFETVQELRCDLRWKAACGLGLHDMAFDPSLLAYFRRRLARSARPNRIFEAVREVVKATGVLKGKHRRALDSTVLDDAVATQDTVTQIIAAVRAVIRELPGAAEVAAVQCTAHHYADPGKPKIAWNDEHARAELVDALVTDALRLLGHLPEEQLAEKAANAVGILALVAGQDPGLVIVGNLVADDAQDALVKAASDAELTVLGSRGLTSAESYFLGSVSMAVVPGPPRPVILVRPEPREKGASPAPGGVVVALKLHGPCDDLLAFAFEAAATRGVPLQVVHGRSLPLHAHTPWGMDHGVTEEITEDARKQLGQVLHPWREKFPGVEPVDAVRLESPAEAVVRAAEGAELLVVGRRKHRPPLAPRLGPVAHAALHHARCPVAVVPHD
jgi:nucleotide-binding universal stress UspA family protein/transposase